MMRALLFLAVLGAGPVNAAATDPAELLDLLETRCLVPVMAGEPGDITGLELPDGLPAVGTKGSEHKFPDVVDGVDLELRTLQAGVHSCGLSYEVQTDQQADAANDLLAGRLSKIGFQRLASPCDSETITKYVVLESTATNPRGNLIGALSFVIKIEGLPATQNFAVAESNVPLTRQESCDE